MFSNFLYIIIVLMIYGFYTVPEKPVFGRVEALFVFSLLTLFFSLATYIQFRHLETRITKYPYLRFDQKYGNMINRQMIFSIILFTLSIYLLDLPMLLRDMPLLNVLPTLEALFFLALFFGFLIIIWSCALRSHNLLQHSDMSLKEFLLSQLSFFIPVLIPFVLASGMHDILFALPVESLKQFLATTEGETVYFIFLLVIMAILGPVLIQKSWGCKPLEKGMDRSRIEAFCRKAGLEFTDILNWPLFGGRMITAGVMGFVKRFRYILVTPALLKFLDPLELDAVIAHEIGHVKKKHLVFYFVFVATFILTVMHLQLLISQFLLMALFKIGWLSFLVKGHKGSLISVISSLELVLFVMLCVIYFRYIFGYFMRNFEREADIHVYKYHPNADYLVSSLKKIAHISGQSPEKPNWHHFSIKERIDYLSKCDTDRTWIARHKKKIRVSLIFYLIVMIAINSAGYALKTGETAKKLNIHLIGAMISSSSLKDTSDPDLLLLSGEYYLEIKDDANAILAYEKLLSIYPDHPEALNNLAWLLATSEDRQYRDPEKALKLAQQAASLKSAAHILDTLAEAYFVNGKYKDALETEKKAFRLINPNDDRPHYEKQLKKFEAAVKKR